MRGQMFAMLNKKGMTLVEVLVAMVLSLIISLALLQTSLIGIEHNVKNSIRDEAVGIAEKRINELRGTSWPGALTPNDLSDTGGVFTAFTVEPTLQRNIRTASVTFTPTKNIDDLDSNTKQVTVRVSWTWKGATYTHSATTVLRNPS